MFSEGSRWAGAWLRFFRIERAELARFLLNLRVAALFHDVGKANADFQRAVSAPGAPAQSVRHEHLSGLLLCHAPVREWLAADPRLDLDAITAAVLGHHLKVGRQGRFAWCQPRTTDTVGLYLDHAQVRATFERVAAICDLAAPPSLPQEPFAPGGVWRAAFDSGHSCSRNYARSGRRDAAVSAFFGALKAGVVVADTVASATAREGLGMSAWLDGAAHTPAITRDEVRDKIIEPRLRQISARTGAPATLHGFQQRAASLGRRVLLLAACGSGKTMAAWSWAAAQAEQSEIGRIIFLYPTRGTATEGFRDYVGWAPETEARLLHGTSAYELAEMRSNPPESLVGKELGDERADRLFALGHWPRRFFSATADQFLAFLENRYQSLALLPVLADSALVIDEIHSFDRSMFDRLIAFLRRCDLPVLCMTATLPPTRRRQLAELGLRIYPQENERVELEDLERAEHHPRYRLEVSPEPEPIFARAAAAVERGERVLWVVNTVARCQALVRGLEARLSIPVLAYHSRFRLSDRRQRHEETVASFQQRQRPAIAVTTQVCEMSLDLDADLLITESAPVTSLIQRFGRANRHLARGPDFRGLLVVYPPESVVPYDRAQLDAAGNLLAELEGRELSQRELAEALERHAPGEPLAEGASSFFQVGYWATRGAFRDEADFAGQCLLDADLEEVARLHARREPIDAWVLSVPRAALLPAEMAPSWLPAYLGVAPAASYDPRLGFLHNQGDPS